jgi:hypothetical protein
MLKQDDNYGEQMISFVESLLNKTVTDYSDTESIYF